MPGEPEDHLADGEVIEVEVGPPVHGGHCLARLDGRVVFVRHALEGERVMARLTERRRKGFWRADAVDVLTPSADRVDHVWPEAGPGGVGGAELGHVAPQAQLRWKRDVLRDALIRIGSVDPQSELLASLRVGRPGPEHGLGTRTRIELTADDSGRAGMFRNRTHEVVPLTRMPLAVDALAELEVFSRTWPAGARLDLVAASASPPVVLVDSRPMSGGSYVRERVQVGEREYLYRLAASGFWQVHRSAPQTLTEAVLEAAAVGAGHRVIDAYSGAGLFSSPLADAVGETGKVLAVEADERAAKDARRNAHAYPQIALRHADTARGLTAVRDSGERPDVVVLDPPRAGAGPAVMRAIADIGVPRVVYVACDPAALARDVATAAGLGYTLRGVDGYDLFPHTHHLEAVAVLERA